MSRRGDAIQPGWLSGYSQMADYAGVSERLVREWRERGFLKVRRLSQRMILARPADVDRAIEAMDLDFRAREG